MSWQAMEDFPERSTKDERSRPDVSTFAIVARSAAKLIIGDASEPRSSNWRIEMVKLPKPESHFIQIQCPDCGNEQVVFDHASTTVTCLVCGATIVHPKGGKAEIKGEIVKVVE